MTMCRPVTVVTSAAISKNDASKIGLAAEAGFSDCRGRSPESISKRLSVTKIPFADSDSRILIPANARSVSLKYSSVLKQKMRSYLPPFLAQLFKIGRGQIALKRMKFFHHGGGNGQRT